MQLRLLNPGEEGAEVVERRKGGGSRDGGREAGKRIEGGKEGEREGFEGGMGEGGR